MAKHKIKNAERKDAEVILSILIFVTEYVRVVLLDIMCTCISVGLKVSLIF